MHSLQTYYCPPEKLEVRVKAFWAEHRPVYCEVVNKKANIEINGEVTLTHFFTWLG